MLFYSIGMHYLERALSYCLLLIFLGTLGGMLYPWPQLFMDSYYDHKRLIQVTLLVVAPLPLVFASWRQRIQTLNLKYLVGFLVFFLGSGLSLINAQNIQQATFLLMHWGALAVLFVVFSALIRDVGFKYIALLLVFLQVLLTFKAALFSGIAIWLGDTVKAIMVYPGVLNIRFFNQFQVFSMALMMFIGVNTRWNKWLLVCLGANFLLVYVGGARGLMLSLASVSILIYLFMPQLRRQITYVTFIALGAYVGYQLAIELFPGGAEIRDIARQGSSGRIDMWVEVIQSLSFSSIWVGHGMGHYSIFSQIPHTLQHPHNSILQILIECGVLSLIGILSAILMILYCGVKALKSEGWFARGGVASTSSDRYFLAAFMGFVASLIYSLFSGIIVMPVPQTLLFIFSAAVWGYVCRGNAQVDVKKSSSVMSLLVGFGIVAYLGVYLHMFGQYAIQQLHRDEMYVGPSFWQSGDMLGDPLDSSYLWK